MSGFKKMPDGPELQRLRQLGWSAARIAEWYSVTENGVERALDRADADRGRSSYRALLPWAVSSDHISGGVARRFRTILRLRQGYVVPSVEMKELDEWLDWLEESELVVNYHPEALANELSPEGGFYCMKREPSDEWIIRMPGPGAADAVARHRE